VVASDAALARENRRLCLPPPKLSLSQWADVHFRLSPESSAHPGPWRTLPYQRAILDALSDPAIERVSWMKSARVGATKCMNAAVAYHMAQDPCPIMVVQPTVEDAEGYSKDEIAPMVRDVPVLAGLVVTARSSDNASTVLAKVFPGGKLLMVGANSARGFRRVSIRFLAFDETDGYPASAGDEGDQIRLGIRRTEHYWNRKIYAASTPTLSGASRIEELFLAGDQRRYHVPCLACGVFDVLVFRQEMGGEGHYMAWPEGRPEAAHFVCSTCGRAIEHKQKREMVEAGAWRAEREFAGHASFHLWAAYSYAANATWGQIAAEYVESSAAGAEQLKTFWNTVLGLPWATAGDAPEWRRLWDRRESYPIGTVPAGVQLLTAGVDVQKDRLVYEVVGWGPGKESWSVEAGVLPGDTASEGAGAWRELDALLAREWTRADGAVLPIAVLAVDSGWSTQTVYAWASRYPASRVMATKGVTGAARALLGVASPAPSGPVPSGRKLARTCLLWPVGVDLAKSELYGWLRLEAPTDGSPPPPGYCHVPEYDEEWFRQLTAEQLVTVRKRTGHTTTEWQIQPGRQNHFLDARIYARAAAARAGVDRLVAVAKIRPAPPPPPDTAPLADRPRSRDPWLDGKREMGSSRGSFWDRRR
jgi:phage terminase large subunit GpA-like protein